MGFERLKREKEAEEQRKQAIKTQDDAERKIREATDKLEYEKQLELAGKRDETTRAFLNDSGIRSKLNEFIEIIEKGSILNQGLPGYDKSINLASLSNLRCDINPESTFPLSHGTFHVFFPRRDPHSVLDVMGWRTQPEAPEYHGYSKDTEYNSCLVTEICPDGLIKIHGTNINPISEIALGPFRIRRGAEEINGSTTIPETTWRNDPKVVEEAILKAYKYPIPLLQRTYEPPEPG